MGTKYEIQQLQVEERRPIVYRIVDGQQNIVRITIEPDPNKETGGNLSITGDFGDYSYYWGAMGKGGMIAFLHSLNLEYMSGKLGVPDVFHFTKTMDNMKINVFVERRQNNITKERARNIWDDLNSFEESDDINVFQYQAYNSEYFKEFDDIDPVKNLQPRFLRFWNNIWRPFISHLYESHPK